MACRASTSANALWPRSIGVRGIGSLFYLAYAATHADFPEIRWLWSVVAFTVVVSVYLHGFTAPLAMAWQERGEQSQRRAGARS